MEDLLSIVVLIIYFVAMGAAGKNKKKKKAGQKAKAAASREAQFEQAFERIAEAVLSTERGMAQKKPAVNAEHGDMLDAQEGTDPCHEAMLAPQRPSMQLKTATQEDMRFAGEGEDPCHCGDATEEEILLEDSPVYRSPVFHTEDQEAFAQDVLRGVIMSEVLMRPGQRRIGGMKRGA